jgi:hypothetical protein
MIGERAPFRRGWTRRGEQNSRKPAKADENKNACICFLLFFGIGTFQWVTLDSNRKIPVLSQLRPRRPRKRLARSVTGRAIDPAFLILARNIALF